MHLELKNNHLQHYKQMGSIILFLQYYHQMGGIILFLQCYYPMIGTQVEQKSNLYNSLDPKESGEIHTITTPLFILGWSSRCAQYKKYRMKEKMVLFGKQKEEKNGMELTWKREPNSRRDRSRGSQWEWACVDCRNRICKGLCKLCNSILLESSAMEREPFPKSFPSSILFSSLPPPIPLLLSDL